jgi:hypothetical protein
LNASYFCYIIIQIYKKDRYVTKYFILFLRNLPLYMIQIQMAIIKEATICIQLLQFACCKFRNSRRTHACILFQQKIGKRGKLDLIRRVRSRQNFNKYQFGTDQVQTNILRTSSAKTIKYLCRILW